MSRPSSSTSAPAKNLIVLEAAAQLEVLAVMYAMMWPPYYNGRRSYGKPLVPDHFHSQVMPSSGPPSGFWLVMFTVHSTYESIAVLPMFDELATEFSSTRLRFGEVDVGSWKELAEHFKVLFCPSLQITSCAHVHSSARAGSWWRISTYARTP